MPLHFEPILTLLKGFKQHITFRQKDSSLPYFLLMNYLHKTIINVMFILLIVETPFDSMDKKQCEKSVIVPLLCCKHSLRCTTVQDDSF